MKAEPLPATKHNALARIVANNKRIARRLMWRDAKIAAAVTAAGMAIAAVGILVICALMEIPL